MRSIDAAPEERERGITINTRTLSTKLLNVTTLIDAPGHADYVKT